MTERSLSIVTGFWPQKHTLIRSHAAYVRLFEELVEHIDGRVPIVCSADPRLDELLRPVVERHPGAIVLDPIPFEDLHFVRQRERFADLLPANSSHPVRDTIEYAMIVWSKIDVVRRAAEANRFGTTHVGWIDFGMPHVVELMDVDWNEVALESVATDRVRVCERYATTPAEVVDPWYFYSNNSARICGGFITAPREAWSELTALFDTEIDRMVPTGSYALEEQVLAALTALKSDFFDRWYADYFGILKNVRHVRRDVDAVLANLRHCREIGLFERGAEIARMLLDSGASYLRLEPEQCVFLLDDGLGCAVHADSELAELLANTVLGLFHYSRVGRGAMRGVWRKSLQASLRALNLDWPNKPWTWEEMASRPDFRVWMSCF